MSGTPAPPPVRRHPIRRAFPAALTLAPHRHALRPAPRLAPPCTPPPPPPPPDEAGGRPETPSPSPSHSDLSGILTQDVSFSFAFNLSHYYSGRAPRHMAHVTWGHVASPPAS